MTKSGTHAPSSNIIIIKIIMKVIGKGITRERGYVRGHTMHICSYIHFTLLIIQLKNNLLPSTAHMLNSFRFFRQKQKYVLYSYLCWQFLGPAMHFLLGLWGICSCPELSLIYSVCLLPQITTSIWYRVYKSEKEREEKSIQRLLENAFWVRIEFSIEFEIYVQQAITQSDVVWTSVSLIIVIVITVLDGRRNARLMVVQLTFIHNTLCIVLYAVWQTYCIPATMRPLRRITNISLMIISFLFTWFESNSYEFMLCLGSTIIFDSIQAYTSIYFCVTSEKIQIKLLISLNIWWDKY